MIDPLDALTDSSCEEEHDEVALAAGDQSLDCLSDDSVCNVAAANAALDSLESPSPEKVGHDSEPEDLFGDAGINEDGEEGCDVLAVPGPSLSVPMPVLDLVVPPRVAESDKMMQMSWLSASLDDSHINESAFRVCQQITIGESKGVSSDVVAADRLNLDRKQYRENGRLCAAASEQFERQALRCLEETVVQEVEEKKGKALV